MGSLLRITSFENRITHLTLLLIELVDQISNTLRVIKLRDLIVESCSWALMLESRSKI